MYHPTQMSAADTGLLVIDVQEKLIPLVPHADQMIRNVSFLVDAAKILGMTVQATEQYPKGLGVTVKELAAKLPERPEKMAFSCCAIPAVIDGFRTAGRPKVLLAGIETHVCVQQTALDLLALDFRVYVAADAVASRSSFDHDRALERMEGAGVIVTSSESAVFEWVGVSGTPEFKQISRLVQDRMKNLTK